MGSRVIACTAVLVVLVVAAIGVGETPAGALGTTHKLNSPSKVMVSSIPEKLSWSFSCNDATGVATLKISNLNVLDHTGHIAGSFPNFTVEVASNTAEQNPRLSLSQNSSNGLFGITASWVLAEAGHCSTGAVVEVGNGGGFGFYGYLL